MGEPKRGRGRPEQPTVSIHLPGIAIRPSADKEIRQFVTAITALSSRHKHDAHM